MNTPDVAAAWRQQYTNIHLDWTDVACPECGAQPGDDCTSTWYGAGYTVVDNHPARHEAAGWHELSCSEQDGHTVYTCSECDWIDVN